jgi:hypothetical protein
MTNTLAFAFHTLKTMITFFYGLCTETPVGIFTSTFIFTCAVLLLIHLFRATAPIDTFGEDPFDEEDYR